MFEGFIQGTNTMRFIFVISPNEKKRDFSIGRLPERDIMIPEISVSRFHGILRWKEDGFYIEDNDARYGTLECIKKLNVKYGETRMVQVGRTVIKLAVKET